MQKPLTSETPTGHSFWSYCVAILLTFAIADVLTGGKIIESIWINKVEYAVAVFAMIATIGGYARDGSRGIKFVRACSYHKL